MIIKTFIAESAAAALKQVRHAMGGDAVVLKTRQVRDARGHLQVEVTALLDRPTVGQTESILDDSQSSNRAAGREKREMVSTQAERVMPANASRNFLNRFLKDADFSGGYAELLAQQVQESNGESDDAMVKLSDCLVQEAESFIKSGLTLELGDKVMVVGPAGSGKTSVIGKLAVQLIIHEKKKVRFLTLDNLKVGAADEIQNYADLLGADVVNSRDSRTDDELASDCVTLIDTPALPSGDEQIARLIERATACGSTYTLLCLSCLTRESDLAVQFENYKRFEPRQVVMTMTDLSWRYGSVLSCLKQSGLPLVGVTDNSGGLGRLHLPSSHALIDAMLKGEVYREPSEV